MTPTLRISKLLLAATAVGVVGSTVGWITHAEAFYYSYLLAWFFAMTVVLGMAFFVMLQHVTDAGWSTVVRRPAEQFLAAVPVLIVLSAPLIVAACTGHLFHWTHAGEHSEALEAKRSFLNLPFFLVRQGIYFTVFLVVMAVFRGKSLKQDASGDQALSLSMRKLAAPCLALYALSFTFLSIDWLMTLQYEWFSTIFGVYVWAGSVVAAISMLAVVVVTIRHQPAMAGRLHRDTFHDVGRLMFAFAVFWAYIALSQFFLIWYANIPEETEFYIARWHGPWKIVSVLLVAVRFVLPFLVMMSANVKRRPRALVGVGLCLLGGHYLDLYWLIMPARPGHGLLQWSWLDLCTLAAVGGITLLTVVRAINGASPFPTNDPRLHEAAEHGHHGAHAAEAH